MSIDPVSGRNPGYCFVDFYDAETANRALMALPSVTILGRTLRVGPCEPKKPRNSGYRSGERDEGERRERNLDRWGNWGQSAENGERSRSAPRDAENSTRLYVGGLGDMTDQESNQAEMRELFQGFNP